MVVNPVDEAEARLRRLLHPASGYSHAENILYRFNELSREMPHDEAILALDKEVHE